MEMFAKVLLSFTAIVVFFTSIISYIHAQELPKIPFSNTPDSSDIPGLSLGDTYATTKFSRDPWNSGYMPFATPDFTKEFSSSRAQQPPSEVEDPVFKPAGLGLNGWGRIPRAPKPDGLGLDGWGRIPRAPKPDGLGLNGWGRIPRAPKYSHQESLHIGLPRRPPPPTRAPPRKSPRVWLAVDPTFEPPSPKPTDEPSPLKTPISVTEPSSLDPAIPPSPALDLLDPPGEADSPTVEPPTATSPSGDTQEFKHLIF